MATIHELYSSGSNRCTSLWSTGFVVCLILLLFGPSSLSAQGMKKVPLPFSPIGINCLPWFVAKEARIYEKHGIDVDPVFIGAFSIDVVRSSGYGRLRRAFHHFERFAGWRHHSCDSHGSAVHAVNHG